MSTSVAPEVFLGKHVDTLICCLNSGCSRSLFQSYSHLSVSSFSPFYFWIFDSFLSSFKFLDISICSPPRYLLFHFWSSKFDLFASTFSVKCASALDQCWAKVRAARIRSKTNARSRTFAFWLARNELKFTLIASFCRIAATFFGRCSATQGAHQRAHLPSKYPTVRLLDWRTF